MIDFYHQFKISIGFWCRQKLNFKSLIQLSDTLLVELIRIHVQMMRCKPNNVCLHWTHENMNIAQ